MLSFENIFDLLVINNNNKINKILSRQTFPEYASHIVSDTIIYCEVRVYTTCVILIVYSSLLTRQ